MKYFRIFGFTLALSFMLLSACEQEVGQSFELYQPESVAAFIALPQIDEAQAVEATWHNELLAGRLFGGQTITRQEVEQEYWNGGSVYRLLRKRNYPNAVGLAKAFEQHIENRERTEVFMAEWLRETNAVSEYEVRSALQSDLTQRLLTAERIREIIVHFDPKVNENEAKYLTCIDQFSEDWNNCNSDFLSQDDPNPGHGTELLQCRDRAIRDYGYCTGGRHNVGQSFPDLLTSW